MKTRIELTLWHSSIRWFSNEAAKRSRTSLPVHARLRVQLRSSAQDPSIWRMCSAPAPAPRHRMEPQRVELCATPAREAKMAFWYYSCEAPAFLSFEIHDDRRVVCVCCSSYILYFIDVHQVLLDVARQRHAPICKMSSLKHTVHFHGCLIVYLLSSLCYSRFYRGKLFFPTQGSLRKGARIEVRASHQCFCREGEVEDVPLSFMNMFSACLVSGT